jgi:hypothetical protein
LRLFDEPVDGLGQFTETLHLDLKGVGAIIAF